MALTVETGAIVASADSYISLADANAYFVKRNDPSDWDGADDAAKENALRIATMMVDTRYDFVGSIVDSDDQVLVWPRYGAFDRHGRYFDSNVIPQVIKDAVCEFALINLRDGDLTEPLAVEAKRLKLDEMEIETYGNSRGGSTEPKYKYVDNLLRSLLTSGGNGRIGRLERHN